MTFDGTKDAVLAFMREHMALAELAVFVMGFGEGIPGLSLLIPSSPLFLAMGAMHGAAGGLFWHLWLPASIGAVIGDCVTYTIGRRYKNHASRLPFLSRYPGWEQRGRDMFERWGVLAIVGGKFTGFMRPFIPIVAGALQMPFWLFLPASIISSFVWAGAFLAPGYGITWILG
ncbi:MAG: DedA family protein [Hyphomicrobiaceae bacterium]